MKRFILLVAVLLSVLFTGCIYEDLSNCPVPGNFTLYFQYTGDEKDDIFKNKIEKVNLYLFDENDQLLQIQEVGRKQLAEKQAIELWLEEGVYKVVGWGNAIRYTNIQLLNTTNSLFDWYVFPSGLITGNKLTTNDPICFGTHIIESITGTQQTDTLFFQLSSY